MGALHQCRDFIEQGIVLNRHTATAHAGGCGGQLPHDLGLALGKAGDDGPVTRQGLRIRIGIGQHHRIDRRFKAVAVGVAPGLQAQGVHRYDVAAMQGH